MTQKGKSPPIRTVTVHKNPPPRTKQGFKSPTPGHKVSKCHRYIYKLYYISSFLSQQIKLFFNEDTDHCNKKLYHLLVTRLNLWAYKALYDIYKCKIKSKVSVLEYYTPNIKCLIIIKMFLILYPPLIIKIILIFLALVQSKFEYFSLKMYKVSEQPQSVVSPQFLLL